MARRKRKGQKKGFSKRAQDFAKREGPVIFVYISVMTGATVFTMIVGRAWNLTLSDWIWLVIASSLLGLPKVFARLKNSREPYLIRFARAFRAGFLSLSWIAPNMSTWVSKTYEMWKKINDNPEENAN